MKAAELVIRPLSEIFGAEVLGVDASNVPEDLVPQLRAAWHRHALLLFRDQKLSPEDQVRFLSVFGEQSMQGYEDRAGVTYVSNVVEDGVNPAGPLGLHFDHSFYPKPLRGLMLYAIEAPPEGGGGETFFSSATLAYRALPAALKARIDGLMIRHGYPDLSKATELPGMDPDPNLPRHDHPLAYSHPVTGEKLLFLSRRHADRILGLSPEESSALIDELSSYFRNPEIIYTHAWRPGDVVVWDNLALQHARNDFDPKYKRHLRRLQVA